MDQYDYVLIDCPPNLGFITKNGIEISDYYLIPTIPDILSTYGIPQVIKSIDDFRQARNLNIQCLGLIVTKFDSRSSTHDRVTKELPKRIKNIFSDLNLPAPAIFNTKMPQTNTYAEAMGAMSVNHSGNTFRGKYGYYKVGDMNLYDYIENLCSEFIEKLEVNNNGA